jgi:outer membrane PBP1 activator LpoA protein
MRIALYCIILALLCQACNQTTKKDTAGAGDPEAQAQQLIVTGNYLGAASEYTRLASLYPEKAIFYQLRTADSFIRADEAEQANDILDNVVAEQKNDIFYRNILLARIALGNNQAQSALNYLVSTPEPGTLTELLAEWHKSKAEAHELSMNFADAVSERIQLDAVLLDPAQRLSNIRLTWEDLNRIELPLLTELRSTGSESLMAWVELTMINQTLLFKPVMLDQALNSWIEQYPEHVASPTITRDILALSNRAVLQPKHIALLLPLTGQYEKASHAIRNGFLAAWYNDPQDRPRISVYDANALNVETIYHQAVRNGADFIVGPLEKNAVDNLLRSGNATVTTLALNHGEETGQVNEFADSQDLPQIIQFGLSPEDEARQVAERAIFDGHNRALVITPSNDWGLRLADAFEQTWSALGGKVLEYVSYDHRSKDYSTPVKKLLNIDSSQLRGNKLRQKVNRNLKTEPRLREDADMIFMAAVPLSARQIVPQLRFYRATDIPVYASSATFSGVEDRQADSDMNGVVFTDIPALLDTNRLSSPIHTSINNNWSANSSNFRRLYALGIDAYRMIPYIGKLSLQDTAVYHGETGDLYMSKAGRIQRKLLWSKFVNGVPTLLDVGLMH